MTHAREAYHTRSLHYDRRADVTDTRSTLRRAGSRTLAWALVAIVALYVQSSFWTIPHVSSVRDFNPVLIDRLAAADGNLVLIEGSPHRDLDSDATRRTERTPFDTHFESHLPEATGRRYFGQPWDGWHWTPYRANYVAGGAFRGEHISHTPPDVFIAELRKWGIRQLFVWSTATREYLDAQPEVFAREAVDDRWFRYELQDADPGSVVTQQGHGTLEFWAAFYTGAEARCTGRDRRRD